MRIWAPIPPLCLDRQRLLGEHRELHAIWTILRTGRKGYRNHPEVKRWVGHLPALAARHELLVVEMQRRGYKHISPLIDAQNVIPGDTPPTWQTVTHMRALLAHKLTGAHHEPPLQDLHRSVL